MSAAPYYPVRAALLPDDVPEPPRSRSRVGHVLCAAGTVLAFLGLFALPVERIPFTTDFTTAGPAEEVSYGQLHSLADQSQLAAMRAPDPLPRLSGFWWLDGLLMAAALLGLLVCVLMSDVRPTVVGLAVVLVAGVTGAMHAYVLGHTSNYAAASGVLPLKGSLFLYAGTGTWVAFVGLAATAIGGGYTFVTNELAQRANASSKAATASASA